MPDPVKEKEKFELVRTIHLHQHSKTCIKYSKEKCRFHSGRFFLLKPVLEEPLPGSMPKEIKIQVLLKQREKS